MTASAWAMIERCARGQKEAGTPEGAAMQEHNRSRVTWHVGPIEDFSIDAYFVEFLHCHTRPSSAYREWAPNLLLWNGARHQLALVLKED